MTNKNQQNFSFPRMGRDGLTDEQRDTLANLEDRCSDILSTIESACQGDDQEKAFLLFHSLYRFCTVYEAIRVMDTTTADEYNRQVVEILSQYNVPVTKIIAKHPKY